MTTIEMKQKSDQYIQINVKNGISTLYVDIFRNGKYLKTEEINVDPVKIS